MKALLDECHLTASDFALHRDVTPQHVNNWFKRGVPLARLDDIAELLCVQSKWLRTGKGPKHPPNIIREPNPAPSFLALPAGQEVHLPFYHLHNGQLLKLGDHHLRLQLKALQELGVDPDQAIGLQMPDNSLGADLPQGSSLAIARTTARLLPNERYAVLHQGKLHIQYLKRVPGGALQMRNQLHSEQPDIVLSRRQQRAEGVEILGWVFWWAMYRLQRPKRGKIANSKEQR
ncbi:transcriptional regulator [Pseudomonas sp. R5(2019)]|uniref:transcriptional regulator n=1 Tax=Pseudomonas sp. R5(2019) TaxID=2697566 RepID=UPI00211401B0|nr:transcriptional regulator [Pseudomonas sp. R5(2019)]